MSDDALMLLLLLSRTLLRVATLGRLLDSASHH